MQRELRERKKNEEEQREGEAWTCLQVELNFFHEREARVVDFLCFLRQKRARVALEPTTGAGNEKPRTLRKSKGGCALSRYPPLAVFPCHISLRCPHVI